MKITPSYWPVPYTDPPQQYNRDISDAFGRSKATSHPGASTPHSVSAAGVINVPMRTDGQDTGYGDRRGGTYDRHSRRIAQRGVLGTLVDLYV